MSPLPQRPSRASCDDGTALRTRRPEIRFRRHRRRNRQGAAPGFTSRALSRARLLVQNGLFLLGAAVLLVVACATISSLIGAG